jgi:hypothetical protein
MRRDLRPGDAKLFGRLQLIALHFPFYSNEKIEMHAFRFEPSFQRLAGFRAKLHKHLPFQHVDQNALSARGPAGLHALCERFRSLPREASERVLRKVAWHRNSCVRLVSKYFTGNQSSAATREAKFLPAKASDSD